MKTPSVSAPHSRRVLAVIDPAVRCPELECFNRIAAKSPIPATYHQPALFGLESLTTLNVDHIAGAIILGSGASVREKHAWQDDLLDWVAGAMNAQVPLLGLCYGHQLLAHAAGASVDLSRADGEKHLGLRKLRLSESRLWGAGRDVELIVSHREMVMNCPPGWRITGASERIPVEALQHESLPVWSFQAHPEAGAQFLSHQGIPVPATDEVFADGWLLIDCFLRLLVADSSP